MLLINDFWCKLHIIATDYQYITEIAVLAEYSAAVEGLKVIYHALYGMNNYSLIWGDHVTLSEGHMIANHPIYGVIDYHVTLSEAERVNNSQSPHIRKHLCPILWQLCFICHKIIHTI